MIIAIIGPKESGKSTVASYLVERHDFTRHSFAGPLKTMLRVGMGLSEEQVYGDQKEVPTDLLCGKTPRQAMQLLGSEWGRNLIHSNLWATAWKNTMPTGNIVVDDMRFPNEHKIVTDLKGLIIAVRRSGHEYSNEHDSEQHELESHHVIRNDEDIPTLLMCVEKLLEHGVKP